MDAPPPSIPPVALFLGGLDPSGGAGLLRDAEVAASLGALPMAIPTAETVQNGIACARIQPPSVDPALRLEALGPHLAGRWGVKVGLCALEDGSLRRLAATLRSLAPAVRIWDPILAPSAGVGLHDGADLRRMADILLPGGGWVASPNRGEAAACAGLAPEAIHDASPQALAEPFLGAGAEAVWLKGGHAEGAEVQDLWITAAGVERLPPAERLPGQRRGTGCTLASAWLCLRLGGLGPSEAAQAAAAWLRARWMRAAAPGGAGRPQFLPEASRVAP
jgi:hydroxymethylpyrimidine/phosphomethylpyrimidine kinase